MLIFALAKTIKKTKLEGTNTLENIDLKYLSHKKKDKIDIFGEPLPFCDCIIIDITFYKSPRCKTNILYLNYNGS